MALQGSGAISFLQLQTEYGGGAPIGLTEYYRGGVNVPSTGAPVTTQTGTQYGPDGTYTVNTYGPLFTDQGRGYGVRFRDLGNNNWDLVVNWAGVTVASFSGTQLSTDNLPLSVSVNGDLYTWTAEALYSAGNTLATSVTKKVTTANYGYQPVYTTTTPQINTSVPPSGQISLSNFYNGTNG